MNGMNMTKIVPTLVDSCGECKLAIYRDHPGQGRRRGVYCAVSGSWIKQLSRINEDCPYDDYEGQVGVHSDVVR